MIVGTVTCVPLFFPRQPTPQQLYPNILSTHFTSTNNNTTLLIYHRND